MSQRKHTAEFESWVEQVMKQGHDKGSAFAICTDSFKKAAKPIFVGEAEQFCRRCTSLCSAASAARSSLQSPAQSER